MDIGVFWGKTGGDGRWHPAICHMIDVGQVARAMVSGVLPPAFVRRLAHALGVSEEDLPPRAGRLRSFRAAQQRLKSGRRPANRDHTSAPLLAESPLPDANGRGTFPAGALRRKNALAKISPRAIIHLASFNGRMTTAADSRQRGERRWGEPSTF